MLTSCSTYNGPTFKGSDYISTDVGTTYHYKRVELKTKKSISIDITVDSCNSNKSKCSYTTKIFDSSGKMISKYSMHYTINKGSFSLKDLSEYQTTSIKIVVSCFLRNYNLNMK